MHGVYSGTLVRTTLRHFLQGDLSCRISVDISSNFMVHVASLVNTGAGPNFVNTGFLRPEWRDSMKTIKSPPLGTANCKVASIEGIVSLLVHIGELRLQDWFGIVQNLSVAVLLGTSFIGLCLREIFPSKRTTV